jgi:acyl carrier protein
MEEIEDKIRDFILKEITWEKPEELDSDTQLIENAVIDSIAMFRLVAFVEEEFNICFPDEDLLAENFLTLRHIARYVKGRIQSKGS